ncbi:MAG: AraC family transcriptional regulator [Eubacteriales bacterium]|nr:AraC family transcriptional regulator [Eubacteriales bacterium]
MKREFDISAISSLYFFEYKSDFIFKSEYHDCFVLLYVETGSCEISHGQKTDPVSLSQGQLFIQAPDTCYSFRASSKSCPTLFACGFFCNSPQMSLLTDRVFCCGKKEQRILSLLAEEGQESFSPGLKNKSSYALERRFNQPFGGEQLIGMYLEMLFINLVRQYVSFESSELTRTLLSESDSVLLKRITQYYQEHLTEQVTVSQVCKEFSIGRSHLQRIFRQETGFGAMEYFSQMRIGAAKKMIRENDKKLTEIAEELGYTSIHYFSRQFKKITGMAPSRYQRTLRTATSDPVYQQIELDNKEGFLPDSSWQE